MTGAISLNVMCQPPVSASSTGQFYWATVTNRDMQLSRDLETTKVSNPSSSENSRIPKIPPFTYIVKLSHKTCIPTFQI
jgi:hypothetical protein